MNTAISVFAILFLVGGTWGIWSQRAPFRSWQPVPAHVVDQSVERETSLLDDPSLDAAVGGRAARAIKGLAQTLGGDDVTNADLIRRNVRRIAYQYYFDGQPYTSSMVYLGSEGSSDDLFDRFPVGRSVTAWVDPLSPVHSYLIPAPRFLGYGLVLTALLMLSLLVAVDVMAIDGGFRPALPGNWLPYMALWWLAGIAAVVDYALLRGPFSLGGVLFALVYFTAASLPKLIPWAKAQLLPWLDAYAAPWLARVFPQGSVVSLFAALAVGFFVLLVVLLPLWFVAMQSYEAYRFRNQFLPVQATVIVSEIRKETRGGGSGARPPYLYYWPEIQFEYRVTARTTTPACTRPATPLPVRSASPTTPCVRSSRRHGQSPRLSKAKSPSRADPARCVGAGACAQRVRSRCAERRWAAHPIADAPPRAGALSRPTA